MALNFPNSPSINDEYPVNGVIYVWDGQKWTAKGSASGQPLAPDSNGNLTITGNLTVNGATITANAVNLSGDLSAANATLSNDLTAVNATLSSDLSAANADLSGNLNVAGDIDND